MNKPDEIFVDGYYPLVLARDYNALEYKLEQMGQALKKVVQTCVPDEVFEEDTTGADLMAECDRLLADYTYCGWCKEYTNHRTQDCPYMDEAVEALNDD